MAQELGPVARLAYVLPAFALAVVGIPIYVFVPRFYSNVVGVDLATVGLIVGGARLLDALLDPLVGVLSDRTRTRFGRRRPWIALGSLPLALALLVLLRPTAGQDGAVPAFAASLFLVFVAWAAVTVPYESLGLELLDGYDERTRLLALRDGMLIAGWLAAASAPLLISRLLDLPDSPAGERTRLALVAGVYGPLLVLTCFACAAVVPERPLPETPPRSPWDRATLRALVANRPFLCLLSAYFVNAIGSNLPAVLMPYYVAEYLRSPRFELYLVVYFVIGIATLPLWVMFARRTSKRLAWLLSTAMNSGPFFFVAFLDRGDEPFYAAIVVGSGLGFGATLALPSSLQADVLDYDELLTGERREGLLLGVWCVLRKLAPALPVGVALPAMAAAGWQEGAADQSPAAFRALIVLYAVVPTVCTAAALCIAWRYPIDREVHGAIKAAIAARAQGKVGVDPLNPRRAAAAPGSVPAPGP
jgi:GPH family glycoside/pentoside/hexuronide:cation symporter